MSTKLNASELAREQFPMPDDPSPYQPAEVYTLREGYITAIREVTQPIADERDEYRKQLEQILSVYENGDYGRYLGWEIDSTKELLAKYP